RNRDTDAGIRPQQFLENEDVREKVRPGSAVLLRHANAHQAELGQLGEKLAWKTVLPIPGRRVRLDLGARELACDRLDLALLRRELEIHRRRYYLPPSRAPVRGRTDSGQAAASSRRISRRCDSRSTKASTIAGSNWRPRCVRISVRATCQLIARLYGRSLVIASRASATVKMRAPRGIRSRATPSG